MNKLYKMFEDLEKEIIKQNIYDKCPDYFEDCVQCKFWDDFHAIKKDVLECIDLEEGK